MPNAAITCADQAERRLRFALGWIWRYRVVTIHFGYH